MPAKHDQAFAAGGVRLQWHSRLAGCDCSGQRAQRGHVGSGAGGGPGGLKRIGDRRESLVNQIKSPVWCSGNTSHVQVDRPDGSVRAGHSALWVRAKVRKGTPEYNLDDKTVATRWLVQVFREISGSIPAPDNSFFPHLFLLINLIFPHVQLCSASQATLNKRRRTLSVWLWQPSVRYVIKCI